MRKLKSVTRIPYPPPFLLAKGSLISRDSGSALGRSFSGYISDNIGRFNTMIITLAWSLIVTFALWLPVGSHVVLFYIFAPLFGFGSGSIISMAPVCLGQLCKADEYGQYYGTSYSLVAFA
jgi:MFS family permease